MTGWRLLQGTCFHEEAEETDEGSSGRVMRFLGSSVLARAISSSAVCYICMRCLLKVNSVQAHAFETFTEVIKFYRQLINVQSFLVCLFIYSLNLLYLWALIHLTTLHTNLKSPENKLRLGGGKRHYQDQASHIYV